MEPILGLTGALLKIIWKKRDKMNTNTIWKDGKLRSEGKMMTLQVGLSWKEYDSSPTFTSPWILIPFST